MAHLSLYGILGCLQEIIKLEHYYNQVTVPSSLEHFWSAASPSLSYSVVKFPSAYFKLKISIFLLFGMVFLFLLNILLKTKHLYRTKLTLHHFFNFFKRITFLHCILSSHYLWMGYTTLGQYISFGYLLHFPSFNFSKYLGKFSPLFNLSRRGPAKHRKLKVKT